MKHANKTRMPAQTQANQTKPARAAQPQTRMPAKTQANQTSRATKAKPKRLRKGNNPTRHSQRHAGSDPPQNNQTKIQKNQQTTPEPKAAHQNTAEHSH
ncbi:hypothetical protein Q8F57_008790 [Paraburkholderia terrae]|uniref:hypothetical protein n=1 Tax=Paraburkholderia terrae TaxID=311230 RepID=UPI00296B13D6|nr:hypothetical protein [Paraburkholderia terrae]MDW3661792.1 hypothetical protein [Paraburkholderia terrae]